MLRKTVGVWVDGDRFFDREIEILELQDRVRHGTHTLLTAQRRMGKTSLVRELLNRSDSGGGTGGVFVNLEDATDPADAIVAIGLQSRSKRSVLRRLREGTVKALGRIEDVQLPELRIKLRAEIDGGNWKQKGDEILEALAEHHAPIVLAIDELPLLVSRMLKGRDYRMTPERIDTTDEFLSWLRRNAQTHRDRICMVVSGSIGIAPILRQAGLSATMNVFSAYQLGPWEQAIASRCLEKLAETYELDLPPAVRSAICHRLRSCIPHHVQQFFDALHRHLMIQGRQNATIEDAESAYRHEMLGPRGKIDMDHYEERLKLVLGIDGYKVALELLAKTAGDGLLRPKSIDSYEKTLRAAADAGADSLRFVLEVLEHDGYLARGPDGYRFESGLLEDWQRARKGLPFIPFAKV